MKNAVKRLTLLLPSVLALCACSSVVSGSKGPTGDPGEAGPNGQDGQNGSNAYQQYTSEHPEYTGNAEQWMDDLVNGRLDGHDCLNGFILSKTLDGKYSVFGYFGGYQEKMSVPSEYKGTPIVSILPNAFNNCTIEELTIPESVERLESMSFMNAGVKTIVGAENVNYIGTEAFAWSAIETFSFGDELAYIGERAFVDTHIKNVVLPSSVSYIGSDAFSSSLIESFKMDSCDPAFTLETGAFKDTLYLKDVTLPAELAFLPDFSFYRSAIETIELPAGLVKIGESAFQEAQLKSIQFNAKLEKIEAKAFSNIKIASLTIPGSVSYVGNSAFQSCLDLTTVRIENGVSKEFGTGVFAYCAMLEEAYIPQAVTKLGSGTFNNCLTGTVYCEATSRPSGWSNLWLGGTKNYMDVIWGYTE